MKHKLLLILGLIAVLAITITCSRDNDGSKTPEKVEISSDKTSAEVFDTIKFASNLDYSTNFMWYFGDGTKSGEKNPAKFFREPGTYEVTIEVNGKEAGSISVTIAPKVSFEIAKGNKLEALSPVDFVNTSSDAKSWSWSFGDPANSTSTLKNPSFTYADPGEYTVTLTATFADGSTKSFSMKITVVEEGKGGEVPMLMYFIDTDDDMIYKLDIVTGKVSEVLDISTMEGVGLAYSPTENKMYFSDFLNEDQGHIWKANLDGSNLQSIASGITDPYNIAIDAKNGRVYWADDAGNISRANLDGSNLVTGVVHLDGAAWRAVAIDDVNNVLYSYEAEDQIIYKSDLDGVGLQKWIEGPYGYAMLADPQDGWLFYNEYIDKRVGNVTRVDLGTGANKVIFGAGTGMDRSYGISVDHENKKVYWTDYQTGKIYRANYDGSKQEVVLNAGTPRGMFVIKK